ncbi:MAG: type II secretion system F family protein [Planctomycetota bacterium]|jgi:tight adherence protein C
MNERLALVLAAGAGLFAAISVFNLIYWLLAGRKKKSVPEVQQETGKTAVPDWGSKFRSFSSEVDNTADLKSKIMMVSEVIGSVLSVPSIRDEVLGRYRDADYPARMTDNQVMGLIVILGLPAMIILAISALLTLPPLFIAAPVLGFGIGYAVLNFWIMGQGQNRRSLINKTMPFVMDLIVMSMNAGASFQMALEQVVSDYNGHPVGNEFSGVLGAVNSGAPLAEAMETFRKRAENIPVAEAFADDVIQSQKLGRPLAETLNKSSERFKKLRIQIANELAGKAKVKILIPGILILFASLMILFGPFAVKFFSEEQNIGF